MKHVFCLGDCESSTLTKTGPKEEQLCSTQEEEDRLCLGYSGYPGGAAHLKSRGWKHRFHSLVFMEGMGGD